LVLPCYNKHQKEQIAIFASPIFTAETFLPPTGRNFSTLHFTLMMFLKNQMKIVPSIGL